MKKNILAISCATLFLAACTNTPNKNPIHESEEILLKENNVPIMITDEEVQESKNKILNENGFTSIDKINSLDIDKNAILSNKTVFFEFNDYSLSEKSIKIIDLHIDLLQKNNTIKIILEGHTDERGEKSYNLNLGEKRGNSVKDYMISKGIQEEQIEVISLGETMPMINESNKSAWSKNRRVVFVYN